MILRQPQFSPLPVEKQVAIIWTATNGWLDDVESARLGEFESGFYRFLESTFGDLFPAIAKEKALSDDTTAQLEKAVKEYRSQAGFGKADDSAKADDTAKSDSAKAEAAGTKEAPEEASADEAPAQEASAEDASAEGEAKG
jgi:hypothetical protein